MLNNSKCCFESSLLKICRQNFADSIGISLLRWLVVGAGNDSTNRIGWVAESPVAGWLVDGWGTIESSAKALSTEAEPVAGWESAG